MTDEEDRRLEKELLADPKERAEHVMLVDLGRNDVGRVAQFGSVTLSDVMVVERYSHVMHISSNVRWPIATRAYCDGCDEGMFTCRYRIGRPQSSGDGDLSTRSSRRDVGPMPVAVGYLDYRGNMDTCIALRTMVVCNGKVYIQAGAGLFADSDPASEYQETVNKARAMLRAVEATEQRIQR